MLRLGDPEACGKMQAQNLRKHRVNIAKYRGVIHGSWCVQSIARFLNVLNETAWLVVFQSCYMLKHSCDDNPPMVQCV